MRHLAQLLLPIALLGCGSTQDSFPNSAPAAVARTADTPVGGEGTVASYLRRARRSSPRLAAARERVHAARALLRASGGMPEPSLTYGFFVSSIETRVGPQRHKLSARQALPWPGTLAAESRAARRTRDADQVLVEVAEVDIDYAVRELYWKLWLTRELATIHTRHQHLLSSLAESVRTQLRVGKASLAEVSQIDLRVAKMQDAVAHFVEHERSLSAALSATCGSTPQETPTVQVPSWRRPTRGPEALVASSLEHPQVRSLRARASAASLRAKSARKRGLPTMTVGADYVEVGPRAGADGSGRDALAVSIGLSLPIYRSRHRGREQHAVASARVHSEEARQQSLNRAADVTGAVASLGDSLRRARVYKTTLLPTAETVLEATLGQYRVARAPFANLVLAEQELIELQIGLAELKAEHEIAWARLIHAAGSPVEGTVEP